MYKLLGGDKWYAAWPWSNAKLADSSSATPSPPPPTKLELPQADDDVTEALVGAVAEDRNWEIAGLIAKGADPNKAKLQNSTILATALSFCGLKTAKALIDGGANVNVRLKKTGQTALALASACPNSSELVALLRAHGAE